MKLIVQHRKIIVR